MIRLLGIKSALMYNRDPVRQIRRFLPWLHLWENGYYEKWGILQFERSRIWMNGWLVDGKLFGIWNYSRIQLDYASDDHTYYSCLLSCKWNVFDSLNNVNEMLDNWILHLMWWEEITANYIGYSISFWKFHFNMTVMSSKNMTKSAIVEISIEVRWKHVV